MTFSRRQIETTIAALVAIVAAIVGLSLRDEEELGPKFLALERVGRFQQPTYLTQPPGRDSPLFVVERQGTIEVLPGGGPEKQPFLDLRRKVKTAGKGGEQGLFSMAFAPDYAESGLFYVAYNDRRDALRVVEFRREESDPLRGNPRSARLVLRIPEPTTKHHGGLVLFGPDRYLYIGSGDGGPSGNPDNVAQNKRSLLGKILRIDPRAVRLDQTGRSSSIPRVARSPALASPERPRAYMVPPDNPFVGRPGRDEIFAYGFRNPRRFSFDRATGAMAIGDVGDQQFEEIDYLPAQKARGANFGWPAYEGFAPLTKSVTKSRTVLPVLAYPHGPGCAVTGGYVVRDPALSRIAGREIVGRYLFGDYCTGRLFGFRPRPNRRAGKERSFRFRVPYLTSFAEDRSGRIYVISQFGIGPGDRLTPGSVYRLVPRRKGVSG
jgi:glucose/arabinose dehydrogenase